MQKLYYAKISNLCSESLIKEKLPGLFEERRRRVLTYKNMDDRARCLGAGLLINYALEQNKAYLEEHKLSLSIEEVYDTESGKPFLKGVSDFYYSISHSGEYVVCGVSDSELGVDIQVYRDHDWRMIKRFFCKEEQERLMDLPETEQTEMFYKLWTAHEGYIKMTGLGLKGFSDCIVNEEQSKVYLINNDIRKGEVSHRTAYLEFYHILCNYMICMCDCEKQKATEIIEIYL